MGTAADLASSVGAAPPPGVAVAVVTGSDVEHAIAPGADPLTLDTHFEIGSVTKTMTALLLARLVLLGAVELDAPIGALFDAGANSSITLRQLATHTSGLPRLPPNLLPKARLDPDQPYGSYTLDDLLDALRSEAATGGAAPEYTNYGYMVLGHALSVAADAPLAELLRVHVFDPLGMERTTAAPLVDDPSRVQGYRDGRAVPPWRKLVGGPGGVDSTIVDLGRYVRAFLRPDSSELEVAIEMTLSPLGAGRELLAWQQYGSIRWHNGGSGGFSSFVAFDRPSDRGVALLRNLGGGDPALDRAGIRFLGVSDPLVDG